MLRFFDGFDHYDGVSMMARKWDGVGATQVGDTYGRFGTGGVRAQYNEGGFSILGQALLRKNLSAANSAWGFFGASFYFEDLNTSGQIVLFSVYHPTSGTGMFGCVCVNSDGSLSAGSQVINNFSTGYNEFAASDPGLITLSSTHYIEAAFNVDDGIVVHLDGIEVINYSGPITPGGGVGVSAPSGSAFTQVRVGGLANGAQSIYHIDDFYYCDDTGTTNNDFLGDVRVYTLWPEDVGASSDFTRSGGTVDGNYTAVDDDSPDDDTSYVETDVPGSEDFYVMQDLSGTDIFAVAVTTCARAADGSAGTIQNEILSNSVIGAGTIKPLSTTYTFIQSIFETNPDTLAQWTAAEVNDAQAGIKFAG